MKLDNYDLKISLATRAEIENRANAVGGICGTISAIQILDHFKIKVDDQEIKEGIKDSKAGTNQVNMALFMSKYLDVTYCVNHDIKSEILKGTESKVISQGDIQEFTKLLGKSINFSITPPLNEIVKSLNKEDAIAQFVFLEPGAEMTHYGVLCKVENNLIEFTQRENQTGKPDVKVEDFLTWWDKRGESKLDPQQLVLIYKKK